MLPWVHATKVGPRKSPVVNRGLIICKLDSAEIFGLNLTPVSYPFKTKATYGGPE